MPRNFALFVVCVCLLYHQSATVEDGKCGDLFLTVSSVKEDNIEINWKFTCDDPPNRIVIFSDDPQKKGTTAFLSLKQLTKEGFYVANISFNQTLPQEWRKSSNSVPNPGVHCLNYWAASYRDKVLVQKTCLKIQPTWMEDIGDKIEDIPFGELFIPGTHNSGCFDDGKNYVAMFKYVHTQDRDIWTQLVFGIRYLDVRVGYYNTTLSKNEFWINHDVFKITQLVPVLREIKQFLSRAKKEVVILDLHRFPMGFKRNEKERHKQLIDLLYKEVGDIALPRHFQKNHGPTLREVWKQGKRLIICYGSNKISVGTSWLWDPLTQYWGNLQSRGSLAQYLRATRHDGKSTQNPLWAAMAELTPSTSLVLFSLLSSKSLAHLADEVNRNVSQLYRHELAARANVVATDYFLGNDIIEVAVNVNRGKGVK